ncbi:O-antigen ligase family protein [Paenibacillus sp. GCM10027626]|uniref:O-antigen ligase family protein n=1 Tax=Paenibacillus sp. GCM10027626 TaxID=3273411 RepID=UPI00362876CA
MKTKNKATTTKKNAEYNFSLIQWTCIICVSLFFIISPFYSGLFNGYDVGHENRLYGGLLATFVIAALFTFFFFTRFQINNYKSVFSILMLLLSTAYFISSFNAASIHYARNMVMISLAITAFFMFGLYFITLDATKRWFVSLIQYSIYFVVVFGLINLFGQTYYPDALWLADTNYRLTSVFQYSNTYAGFLIAALFSSLYLIVHSKRWYNGIIHALMLVPIFLSFLLTYSRGALVLVPFLLLIIIPFFTVARQIMFLFYLLCTACVSFLILGTITSNYDAIARIVQPQNDFDPAAPISFWSELPLQSWGLLLAASVLTVGIVLVSIKWLYPWIESKLAAFSQKKWSFAAIPVLIVGVGLILSILFISSGEIRKVLPEQIANRIESINFQQHSVLERATFYKDALKVLMDYPLLGTGGGGWTAIYQEYQSNPYSSNQAHSYFVQTLVEVGVVGFIVLVATLFLIYFAFIKLYIRHKELRGNHFIFFILSISILVHSSIDFDMSYLYLSVFVFFCLGAMLAPYNDQLVISKWDNYNTPKLKYIVPSLFGVIMIIALSWTIRQNYANQYYGQAMHKAAVEKLTLDKLLPDLDKAINISPENPAFTLTKLDWLYQAYQQSNNKSFVEQSRPLIQQLKQYEPFNGQLIFAEYRNFKNSGAYKEAVTTLNDGIARFPWDINFYEAAIMEHYLLGLSTNGTDQTNTTENWNKSLSIYSEVLSKMKQLESLPEGQLQGRIFEPTPLIRRAIGAIYFYQKEFELSVEILQPITLQPLQSDNPNKDQVVREGVRYYLASLQKTGKQDADLENSLFSIDPQQKILLNQLENNG